MAVTVESSTYMSTVTYVVVFKGMSFMNTKKKSGPRVDTRGTTG